MKRQYLFVNGVTQVEAAEACQLDRGFSRTEKLERETLDLGTTAYPRFHRDDFTAQQSHFSGQTNRCITITCTAHDDTFGCKNLTYFHNLFF